jgi:hypothetical protein
VSLTSHHLFFIQKHHYLTNEFRFLALVMFWHILFTTQYAKYSNSSCYYYKNVFLVWKKKCSHKYGHVVRASIHLPAFLEYSDRGNVLHSYTKMSIKIILQRQLQIDLCVIICCGFFSVKKQIKGEKSHEKTFSLYISQPNKHVLFWLNASGQRRSQCIHIR